MPTARETLELLRRYRALPPSAQRALLLCARLLDADPPSFQVHSGWSLREALIGQIELFEPFLRIPRRGRQRPQ